MGEIRLPEPLAPSGRELLMAFVSWCGEERQRAMVEDDEWTVEQMVDLFITEASSAHWRVP